MFADRQVVCGRKGNDANLSPTLSGFTWNVEEDFKTVPETWIAAHGVKHVNGQPVPDEHGHIPGEPSLTRPSAFILHISAHNYVEFIANKQRGQFSNYMRLYRDLVRVLVM